MYITSHIIIDVIPGYKFSTVNFQMENRVHTSICVIGSHLINIDVYLSRIKYELFI